MVMTYIGSLLSRLFGYYNFAFEVDKRPRNAVTLENLLKLFKVSPSADSPRHDRTPHTRKRPSFENQKWLVWRNSSSARALYLGVIIVGAPHLHHFGSA